MTVPEDRTAAALLLAASLWLDQHEGEVQSITAAHRHPGTGRCAWPTSENRFLYEAEDAVVAEAARRGLL